jgi:geranylgeranyl diphosphate synthase type I
MNTNEILRNVKQTAEKVNQFLDKELNGEISPLWPAARHYIKAGGKRLRPFIVMKTCELLNCESDSIIPIAAAIEVLHNFTLIHDDIMDKDTIRRGIPTVHTEWNVDVAILSGDLLFAMVFVLLNKTNLSETIKAQVSYLFGLVSKELCEGQMLDISFENRDDVTIPEYNEMIRLKTAALFRTAAHIGGICANATSDQIAALKEYGENLGMAFQLIDDILGIIADEKELGKPIGSDIREGKKTYLFIKAIENLAQSDRNELYHIYSMPGKTEEEIEFVTRRFIDHGILDSAKNEAIAYMQKALTALQALPPGPARDDLEAIARATVERKY